MKRLHVDSTRDFYLNSNHAKRIIKYFVTDLILPQTQHRIDRDAFLWLLHNLEQTLNSLLAPRDSAHKLWHA